MRVGLRMLADDLTGALDAAAPFASEANPVRLALATGDDAVGDVAAPLLTRSTETRDRSRLAGRLAVRAQMRRWRAAAPANAIWFKKVDSVLRGAPIAETVEMFRAGGFRQCVFAPAFPEAGRVTRDGYHWLAGGSDGALAPAALHDIAGAFRAAGLRVALLRPGGAIGEAGDAEIGIIDAVAPGDLEAAVAALPDLPGRLWAGSRGLAQALAGPARRIAIPALAAIIVGTTHPVTRAQLERFQQKCAHLYASKTRPNKKLEHFGESASSQESISTKNARETCLLIDGTAASTGPAHTRAQMSAQLERLRRDEFSGDFSILVTGGDTLSVFLRHARPTRVDCIGEMAPGLPVSRLLGGKFDGARLISKSGGFGPPNLFCDLVGR